MVSAYPVCVTGHSANRGQLHAVASDVSGGRSSAIGVAALPLDIRVEVAVTGKLRDRRYAENPILRRNLPPPCRKSDLQILYPGLSFENTN